MQAERLDEQVLRIRQQNLILVNLVLAQNAAANRVYEISPNQQDNVLHVIKYNINRDGGWERINKAISEDGRTDKFLIGTVTTLNQLITFCQEAGLEAGPNIDASMRNQKTPQNFLSHLLLNPDGKSSDRECKNRFEKIIEKVEAPNVEIFTFLLDALQENGVDIISYAGPDKPALSPSQVAQTIRENITKLPEILEKKPTLLEKSDHLRSMGIRGSCISLAIAKFLS